MAIHKQIKYIRCNKGISEWSERSIHHLFDWWLLMFYCLQLHNSCGCSIFLFLSWIACRPLAGDILAITPLTVQLYYVINHFSLYCFFIVCIANWVVCGQLGKNMEKYMEKRLVRALSQNRLSVSRCSENYATMRHARPLVAPVPMGYAYIYIVLNSCASEKDRQIPVAHMLVCAVCHRSRQTAQIIKPENNKMFIIMFMHEIQPCTHPSDSKSTPLRRIMTMQPEITQANAKQQTKILKIKKKQTHSKHRRDWEGDVNKFAPSRADWHFQKRPKKKNTNNNRTRAQTSNNKTAEKKIENTKKP